MEEMICRKAILKFRTSKRR